MIESLIHITAGVLTTLLAGVFFGYAVSVNGGLRRLKDDEYVKAMQSINIVIQNPLFFLSFMGPLVFLPLTTFLARDNNPMQFWLLLVATITYFVFTFGVTIVGNVPLNERLAKSDASDITSAHAARIQFESSWNRLHTIRTIAGVVVAALLFTAYVIY